MKVAVFLCVLVPWLLVNTVVSAAETGVNEEGIHQPLYKPFIERYILDEIKSLRRDQQAMKAELVEKVADAKLVASDRAIEYTTSTVNNIFFMITAAASILVLLGWRSLRDVRENIQSAIADKTSELTLEYEERLREMERKLKNRSAEIIANQEQLTATNELHSLWLRAGLEENSQEKISVYDQILAINPEDVEAMTYKADALLDLGEARWALSLSNSAIEFDDDYSHAYWQRACARAELCELDNAIEDIKIAIDKAPALKEDMPDEKAFGNLHEHPEFNMLLSELQTVDSSN